MKANRLSWVHKRGFTLIELMIVIFIIGVGATFIVPRLVRRSPSAEWSTIRDEMNNMIYFARQEAITTQKTHRLVFVKKTGELSVQEQVITDPGTKLSRLDQEERGLTQDGYKNIQSHYFTTNYQLPDSVEIISIMRGKKDLFEGNKGKAFCHVVPHGLVEDMVITLLRRDESGEDTQKYTVEPFLGKFVLQERHEEY